MSPALIKLCIRAVATVAALFGLAGSFVSLTLFLPESITSHGGLDILFTLLILVFTGHLIRLGYLAWFQWSPVAVRQVLGSAAFVLFAVCSKRADLLRSTDLWPSLIFPGGLLLLLLVYRWSVAHCCAQLFPASSPAPTPPPWRFALAFLVFAAVLGSITCSWSCQIAHRLTP